MRVRIGRRYWTLVLYDAELPRNVDGWCEAPDTVGKRIRIRRALRGKARLETIIHEILHATNWSLDEEHIREAAEDMTNILWKLGYRPQEDER